MTGPISRCAADVDLAVVVVPDRLGAINQARLAYARALQTKLPAGIWLNAHLPVDAAVAASNRRALAKAGVPVWAEQACEADAPVQPARVKDILFAVGTPTVLPQSSDGEVSSQAICDGDATLSSRSFGDEGVAAPGASPAFRQAQGPEPVERASRLLQEDASRSNNLSARYRRALDERAQQGLRRTLRITAHDDTILNLADNDYLALAHDPSVARAVAAAAARYGTSASASPLITGWGEAHQHLVDSLGAWHGFAHGLLWNSGYAANSAVLSVLPARGDLVLADRLIHHSMIAGLLRSGARFKRYGHLDLAQLEEMLGQSRSPGQNVFVATETVFSMDGDYPDLGRMAELKRRHGFYWIVDEAHALGWYGPEGAGLVRRAGVEREVDVLVGTLGKTLAAGGAYTLFHDEAVRDFLVNEAGEFIYSTALPPTNAAAAAAALERVKALAPQQTQWREASRNFRLRLQSEGWATPAGDSPIVPVQLDTAEAALALANALRAEGIWVGAVRPPTVPAGTSRLRFSLKRTFEDADATRVLSVMAKWRAQP